MEERSLESLPTSAYPMAIRSRICKDSGILGAYLENKVNVLEPIPCLGLWTTELLH